MYGIVPTFLYEFIENADGFAPDGSLVVIDGTCHKKLLRIVLPEQSVKLRHHHVMEQEIGEMIDRYFYRGVEMRN